MRLLQTESHEREEEMKVIIDSEGDLFCPVCGSSRVYTLKVNTQGAFCRNCNRELEVVEGLFAEVEKKKKKSKGSGVIAPPAYRYGYRWWVPRVQRTRFE